MKNLFIGIDISKDVFDFCCISESNTVLKRGQNQNTQDGILSFCDTLKEFKDYSPWICMEHTGYYGYLLAAELSKRDFTYSLLSPLDLKRSMGIVRGKTDTIDAYRIAAYALSHRHKLKPYILPTQELQELKVLLKARNRYRKVSTQLKNALKGLQIARNTMDLDNLIEDHQDLIQQINKRIQALENQILQIIRKSDSLNKSYKQLTSVVGVEPITAMSCLVETMNFTKFTSSRKFACHCGIAPFEYRSGTSVKKKAKTSPLCNKTLKGVLYKAASTAIQHDPQLKRYYHRKLNEGKHKLSVLNAVANKLVHRIFAVAKRDTPYVKLSA